MIKWGYFPDLDFVPMTEKNLKPTIIIIYVQGRTDKWEY